MVTIIPGFRCHTQRTGGKSTRRKIRFIKVEGGGCLKSIKACTDLCKGPIFLVFFKIINQGKTVRVSNSSKTKAELIRLNRGAAVTDCVKKVCKQFRDTLNK